MYQLFDSILNLIVAIWNVVRDVFVLVLPWTPLVAWVAFWLLAVDWVKFRAVLVKGGLIGVILIGLMMIMIWGLIAPPDGDTHHIFGLSLSNFVGKTVYVSGLFSIMFLCGSAQLSGACSSLVCFNEEDEPAEQNHAAAH